MSSLSVALLLVGLLVGGALGVARRPLESLPTALTAEELRA
ncbi:MAG TPA: hypothetical protein VEA99_19610 [Gemmatimonadaceae bacterium]|nr:hypothetical protein [Gemmatimonadaceae bacterium]